MTLAPGPPAFRFLRNIRDFRRDILGLLLRSARDYGDVVRFRLGPRILHLVNRPDLIEKVLETERERYDRNSRSAEKLQFVCGRSVLTTDGEFWSRERRLLQPAFHAKKIEAFAPIIEEETSAMLDRWTPGRPLDVASEMVRLTSAIVGRAFLGADLSGEAAPLERALAVILDHTYRRFEAFLDWDALFPPFGNPRYREAVRAVEGMVGRIIADRRRAGSESEDLLGILLSARADGLDDLQLRNETITMLLAGYETTAHALAWTFHLLASDPTSERRVREGDPDFTARAIREALRLYPSIWALERRVVTDHELGGFEIPADSALFISPYALHRRPDCWESPETFDPDRFLPARSVGRAAHAYLPFGAGSHQCIGSGFATLEMRIIVPRVIRRFHLKPLPEPPVVPRAGITLRFRHGLPMIPELAP